MKRSGALYYSWPSTQAEQMERAQEFRGFSVTSEDDDMKVIKR